MKDKVNHGRRTRVNGSTHYRVPKDLNAVIVGEARVRSRKPSEIHRYLLRLAVRDFTPLPQDLVLP